MAKVIAILLMALLASSCSEARPGARCPDALPSDPMALPDCDLEGYERLLATLRGTPVVVNFWGSWCVPCRSEAPHLAAVSRELEGRVRFLGVDISDDLTSARQFIREFGWTYPSIFDPDEEIHDGLGYYGQPNTLIYDPEGNLDWDTTGAVTAEVLREQIRAVL